MKLKVLFIQFIALLLLPSEARKTFRQEMIESAIKLASLSCLWDESASSEDIDKLVNGIAPSTREGTCLAACIAEQFGLVSFMNE